MPQQEEVYSIPARFRKIENLHIVFWLIKDLSWAMLWKPLGLIMVVPTVAAALLITWQTRNIKSELLHNLAVVFWILANAYWMVVEFFSTNESLRYYTIIPFSIGLVIIGYYYLIVRPKEKQNVAVATSNVV
jgi:prepilin signal peptidase PulO-like enzyme (type II secretory pathway)